MATDFESTQAKQAEEQGTERTRAGLVFRPQVDIVEGKDELLILADVPGAKTDSVSIQFEDGVLTIDAAVAERYAADAKFLLFEYGIGDFHRTFRVSEDVDATKIHADYADGVLTVHLPRAEAAKPRKIEVKAAS